MTAAVTSVTYDAAGSQLTLTDPDNNTTTWTYDNLNRPITETNQLTKTRTFKYDSNGNLTERIDRRGRKIVYVYDTLNRNTDEKWYDGANLVRTLSFTYDAAGQLTQASDPAATYGYTPDNLGRVTAHTQTIAGLTPQLSYQSVYNAAGRRTQLTGLIGGTNDFRNTYAYDNLQRLTSLNQQQVTGGNAVAAKRADFTYDPRSLVTKVTRYADATGTEFVANSFSAYDDIGRLTKLIHSMDATAPGTGWGTNPLAGYQYTYDAASRITALDSYADGVTSYTLDNTDQLVTADHTGQTDESYSYDANGNRTMSGYSTGTNNQLQSDGSASYTYDDEGNRLTRIPVGTGERQEYTWDWRNRLTKVTFKDALDIVIKTVDQTYDHQNRWIRRSVDDDGPGSNPALDTFFSHEAGQVAFQFDGSAAADLSHRYLWNPAAVDQLLADEQVTSLSSPGAVQYPLGDQLGTLRDLASHNSTTHVTSIDNHRRYDDYGNLVSESNAAIDQIFGFTGRALNDSTGLQNNLNRWYDAKVGRWLGEDPLGLDPDINPYRYVGNAPTIATDPSGLFEVTEVQAIGGAGGNSIDPTRTNSFGEKYYFLWNDDNGDRPPAFQQVTTEGTFTIKFMGNAPIALGGIDTYNVNYKERFVEVFFDLRSTRRSRTTDDVHSMHPERPAKYLLSTIGATGFVIRNASRLFAKMRSGEECEVESWSWKQSTTFNVVNGTNPGFRDRTFVAARSLWFVSSDGPLPGDRSLFDRALFPGGVDRDLKFPPADLPAANYEWMKKDSWSMSWRTGARRNTSSYSHGPYTLVK